MSETAVARTMNDVPRVMSTQHPDNAVPPFFSEGSVVAGDDEIQEAYYAYSHLGCDEQMWDFEGKEGDEYAVKKLLSRYGDDFLTEPLGRTRRLTIRGPNPDVEESEAKILLEILESIPRSYDAAATFFEEHDAETVAPIHEVIVPMVTDAGQLDAVHDYYEEFVVGKADRTVGDRTVESWVGAFRPESVSVIPLIEDRDSLLRADEIVRSYLDGREVDSQRVFLARSDPAMNYGSLSADLINRIVLSRLADLEAETGTEIQPILGAGSAPFRGHLTPETAAETVEAFPSVETYTVQSAFKYDYAPEVVREGVRTLREAERGQPPSVDEERALSVIDSVADCYSRQVSQVTGLVNRLAEFVPSRRSRKLHVGLFGYSRDVEGDSLPRAITYTATLYSVGFPPTIMGLAGLDESDRAFVRETYPRFFDLLRAALAYYNPRSLEVVDIGDDDVAAALEMVDYETNETHREATDEVLDALERGDDDTVESALGRAARERQFLG